MSQLMTLELTLAPNWAYEGTVDVCYVEASGSERSYGTLAQGSTMNRETYSGHLWHVREHNSRELLMSIRAQLPADGSVYQRAVIGANDDGLDPLRSAMWLMGRAPRERLLAAVSILIRVVGNVLKDPSDPKFRSLRTSNPKVSEVLDIPGVLAFLSCTGFEQVFVDGEPRLALPEGGHSTASLETSAAQLKRLDALLKGLPPPRESLASMQASASSTAAAAAATDEPSHRCAACGVGIENDLRRKMAAGSSEIGGWRSHQWNGGGEYRYHCSKCNVDICAKCYDVWKASNASGGGSGTSAIVHPATCTFSIEAPITTHWGGNGYGVMPAPPPVSSRNRRGPWG
jgi:hypothetical protein